MRPKINHISNSLKRALIKKELEDTINRFPKLEYEINSKTQEIYLKGILDICDMNSEYWGSFNILLKISRKHPYDIPIVYETGKSITPGDNRHISEQGKCCLDIPHKLLKMSKKGIVLCDFIVDVVYPYFANQLYYNKEKEYASGEWQHREKGVFQFYREELNLKNKKIATHFLTCILEKNIPSRNELCLCGKDKFKRCHGDAVNFLISLGDEKLNEDLKLFQTA